MKKRILSLLLCIVMCLSLMPMTVFATGAEEVGGKTLPYSFDFETDMVAEGWTNIDADGDGQDWISGTNKYGAEEWGVEGSRCAISQSYENNVGAFIADNWLFSPAITIPEGGATVSWYEQSQDVSYPDFYEVYVSETNTSTDTSKMTEIFSGNAANPWNQRSVELEAAEYAGKTVYIAFRHLCYDCFILEIDNFAVGAEAPAHTHTVTFDANGGSDTPASAETGPDGKLATLPTPTHSGSYSSDGWYTLASGGTKVDTNTVFTAAATIYAHWSRSFSFAHLPETGVTSITVPAGDSYTGVAAKDAFILYWGENIETDGNFLLIDYIDTDINGYHSWMITIENGVAVATDGGFAEYYTTLDLINNMPSYASWDKWVNGTYSAIHTHAFTYTANNGKITATCVDGCGDGYDTNPLTLTLTAPASLVYNGNAKAFTFADGEAAAWTGAGLELPTITYAAKSGSTLTSDKAVDAGSYTVSVTVDTGKTASLDFEITKNHTHNPKLVNGQAPQKGIAGWKDYYECICGERYEDASGSILIPNLAVWKAEGGNGSLAPLIPAMYTVTFNMGNHGTQIDPQTVEEGNKAIKPADPTASGYTFGGWYADAACTTAFNFDIVINANTPIYAKWTKNFSGSGGSSSGGSSSGSSASATYAITVADSTHGSISASVKTAPAGDTVKITVSPDKGYTLETITVTDKNGKEIDLTATEIGKTYTFKMPVGAITVKATFMEDNTMMNYFVDVTASDYYYDAVLWAAENGITGGVDAVHFAPNSTCTRAQAVTFLWRAAGCPEVAVKDTFGDVVKGSYYEKAVAWAVANGITSGTSATTFSPDADCTRAQIVCFLHRANKVDTLNIKNNPFTDVKDGAYYYNAVLWAAENGITGGTSATTFSPDANCTRAQIVTFLYRFMNK